MLYNLNANAKLDCVCWYTLSGENEIWTEITSLFGRKKGSDKDDIGSAECENDDGTEGRKGRRQQSTPAIYKL